MEGRGRRQGARRKRKKVGQEEGGASGRINSQRYRFILNFSIIFGLFLQNVIASMTIKVQRAKTSVCIVVRKKNRIFSLVRNRE